MVSMAQKLKLLSMGVALNSSIASAQMPQQKDDPQKPLVENISETQKKFDQTKTISWEDAFESDENTTEYTKNIIEAYKEVYTFFRKDDGKTDEEFIKEQAEVTAVYDGFSSVVRLKPPEGGVLIPPRIREKIKQNESIDVSIPKDNNMMSLTNDDYVKLAKIEIASNLASEAIMDIAEGDGKKAEKLMPGLEGYIRENANDTNTGAEAALINMKSHDKVKRHILNNMDKIDKDLDDKLNKAYGERDPGLKTFSRNLTVEEMYFVRDEHKVLPALDSPKMQKGIEEFKTLVDATEKPGKQKSDKEILNNLSGRTGADDAKSNKTHDVRQQTNDNDKSSITMPIQNTR